MANHFLKFLSLLEHYFVIGLLEQLRETLQLFEVLMPKIFNSAVETFDVNPAVAKKTVNSETIDKEDISDSTRKVLEKTIFNYDMDLYLFIQSKFYLQYRTFVEKVAEFG